MAVYTVTLRVGNVIKRLPLPSMPLRDDTYGVTLKIRKWRGWEGVAILPNCISLARFAQTTSGCWDAEIKLRDIWAFCQALIYLH